MKPEVFDAMWAGLTIGFIVGNAFCFFILYLPSRRLSDEYINILSRRI